MDVVFDYLGRVHPLLLHFPIALLVVGAVVETLRLWRDSPWLARSVVWLLAFGALSALATGATGWLLAAHEHVRSDQRLTLEWHRWFGVTTTIVACFAWAASAAWGETPPVGRAWCRRLLVWSAAALVAATGHFGALMVWGKDWFS
jgi:uncharacterized membrane protein